MNRPASSTPSKTASSQVGFLNQVASAHNTHADFDAVLARCGARIIAPQLRGLRVLECGCSTGVMTEVFLESARELHVVEGSPVYARQVEERLKGRLKMFCALFEEFTAKEPYDALVFAHVLHHLEKPVDMLRLVSAWVKPGGAIHITVPNVLSFHRQLGVAMGAAKSVDDTSPRNAFFNQPGRFTRERLVQTVEAAGLRVQECMGFLFKPFPHDIMNSMSLPEAVLDGLFEMGRKYPDLACQIYLRAVKP